MRKAPFIHINYDYQEGPSLQASLFGKLPLNFSVSGMTLVLVMLAIMSIATFFITLPH
ncbi:MAG: hypothetical protein QOG67_1757 [Verrucomicrobiota bacterium]|jgi:hypothetical protein